MNDNSVKWLWMQQLFGIATRRAHEAYERFGSPDEILSTPASRIDSDSFLTAEEKEAIKSPDFSGSEEIIAKTLDLGAGIITPDSPEYPESLRNIHSIPLVLYGMGDFSLLRDRYLISMVGTRAPDEYGAAAAKKLSGEIASLGGVVVSGLAYGIDAFCHKAAIEAGGKTVAFVAAGLDIDYPKKNRALRSLIQDPNNGLVLSEFPLGTPSLAHHFPMRNRLISGVSMATVVVQSSLKSGTMLTAAHAISQNRDLFAVPNSILSKTGEGCNYLLTQGAEPALSGESILKRYVDIYGYPIDQPNNQQTTLFVDQPQEQPKKKNAAAAEADIPAYLNTVQADILRRLFEGECLIDELCEQGSAAEVLTALTGLELFGLVEILPGRMVRRCIS
ncbi:MAG: DNA-processing protein DprA [Oscillospiraceae bacterium]|nr:DNA-processing protein DprA [Oscillospiraceae bacterium]